MSEPPVEEDRLSVMARRRGKIIAELMTTEEAFRRQLQVMVDYFETPMRIRQVIPAHAIESIFGNVHQLIRVNTELKAYLDEMEVGEAFMKIGPFLKLYSVYAKNHHNALSTYEEWEQKSPRFVELKQRQESRPEVKMKFNALLITPVQRIPRYKLLLDDLLNHTLPEHPDYPNLKSACQEIAMVASHINNFIREHQNFNKMLQIQRSLSGNCAPKILGPGRKFIMEGPLNRVSRKGGRAYERMFFLFSDMVLYAKPRFAENSSHRTTYSCCCVLPLHHCSVERMFGGQGGGAMMRLSCKDELLLLYHEDREKIETWITEMKKAIKEVCQSRQSLHKESSARRPMRKPDLVKVRRQEKIRDENQSLTPNKDKSSPIVKCVRNLKDIDSLCCTPKKKLNLDSSVVQDGRLNVRFQLNDTQAAEDSFCIADQSEVDNFDVNLPQYFTKMGIGHSAATAASESESDHPPDPEPPVEADRRSISSRTSVRRSMRRSLSNLSQYSTRLRSSFRTIRQKTSSSCSLRVKTNTGGTHTRLDEIFNRPESQEFNPDDLTEALSEMDNTTVTVDENSDPERMMGQNQNHDCTLDQTAGTSNPSFAEISKIEDTSARTRTFNRDFGSNEILMLANSTNTTPQKPHQPMVKKRLNPLANQRAARKLKRGFGQVVNHVMSPVLEGNASPVLGGYSMVGNNLQNVRHLAESPRSADPAACVVM